jgi:hypothetical protein
MRSNLILFVLVLVNQNFIGDQDEYDDEGGSCRGEALQSEDGSVANLSC